MDDVLGTEDGCTLGMDDILGMGDSCALGMDDILGMADGCALGMDDVLGMEDSCTLGIEDGWADGRALGIEGGHLALRIYLSWRMAGHLAWMTYLA